MEVKTMLKGKVLTLAIAIFMLFSSVSAQETGVASRKMTDLGSALIDKAAITTIDETALATANTANATAMTIQDGQIYSAGSGLLKAMSSTGEVLSTAQIPISNVAGIATYKPGTLIMGDSQDNKVYEFDIATSRTDLLIDLKQVDQTSNLAANVLVSGTLASIASDGANIFVGMTAGYSSSIFKIDPTTGKILDHAWAPGPNPNAMVYEDFEKPIVQS
jgi:hypothetical protein